MFERAGTVVIFHKTGHLHMKFCIKILKFCNQILILNLTQVDWRSLQPAGWGPCSAGPDVSPCAYSGARLILKLHKMSRYFIFMMMTMTIIIIGCSLL
jgi:hypothetical protein